MADKCSVDCSMISNFRASTVLHIYAHGTRGEAHCFGVRRVTELDVRSTSMSLALVASGSSTLKTRSSQDVDVGSLPIGSSPRYTSPVCTDCL